MDQKEATILLILRYVWVRTHDLHAQGTCYMQTSAHADLSIIHKPGSKDIYKVILCCWNVHV